MLAQPGEDPFGAFLGGAITGALSTLAIAGGAALGVYLGGSAIATVIGAGASFIGRFIAEMVGNVVTQKASYGKVDWKVAAINGLFNGIITAASSYIIMAVPLVNPNLALKEYFTNATSFSMLSASVGIYISSLIPNFNDKR